MTTLESTKVTIAKPISELFTFFSDFNNYQHLMPDQVVNWESTTEDCSFTIKGMGGLGMQFESKTPNHIKIIPKGKTPFGFVLNGLMESKSDNETEVQLRMDADMNPFIKMMAEKPLTNFLNLLVQKLTKL